MIDQRIFVSPAMLAEITACNCRHGTARGAKDEAMPAEPLHELKDIYLLFRKLEYKIEAMCECLRPRMQEGT